MDCNYNEDVCLCVTFIKKKIEHIDHKVLKLKMRVGGRVLQGGMGSAVWK